MAELEEMRKRVEQLAAPFRPRQGAAENLATFLSRLAEARWKVYHCIGNMDDAAANQACAELVKLVQDNYETRVADFQTELRALMAAAVDRAAKAKPAGEPEAAPQDEN